MKKLIAISLAMLMILVSFAACAQSESVAESTPPESTEKSNAQQPGETEIDSAEKKETIKIAYLVDSLTTSQNNIIAYMEQYCAYVSEKSDYNVEFAAYDATMDLTKQIANVETCVAMGYDGIILNPVDTEGILPAAKAAMDEGVIICDMRASNDIYNCQIDVADENVRGEMMKQWILDYMDANPEKVLKVGLLYGSPTTPQTFPRVATPATIAEERPDNFVVLAEQYCPNWTTEEAMKVMEDWLQAHPDMNFVISAWEAGAYGVAQVLEQAGLTDQFGQVTVDAEQLGIDMMKDGLLLMDCGTFVPATSAGTVQLLLDAIREGTRGHYDYSDYTVFFLTPENIDEVQAQYDNVDWEAMGEPKKVD